MFSLVTATQTGVITNRESGSTITGKKTIDPDENNISNTVFAENKRDTLPLM